MEQNSSTSSSDHSSKLLLDATAGVSGRKVSSRLALARLGVFFALIAGCIWMLDATITAGLGRMHTSVYGVSNRIMNGQINAQVVVTGSSRAASHYDPRVIRQITGLDAFNLGRNGSQTDMQIAVFKAYLKHNRKPAIVLHNLDAFSFQTTREVYNPAQYVPYLKEDELYQPLRKINQEIWKSRYLPLYGYVAEDMSFAWTLGLRAFLHPPSRDQLIDGFDPRNTKWTNEFAEFKSKAAHPVRWEIEPQGIALMEGLVRLCHEEKMELILVYSPEYIEMQAMTENRREIFQSFERIAARYGTPIWDYSHWRHAGDTAYFTNSQHLNATGAEAFSTDVAADLRKFLASRKPGSPRITMATGRVPKSELSK